MKVRYRTKSGTESTAYLDDGESDTRTGADKYTDEPLTVRWDGAQWVAVAVLRERDAGPVRPDEEPATGKATLSGHPDGPLVVALPTAWTVPPPIAYVHKLSESGRYLSDTQGVFGVPFRLMKRADGSPVVLPDGTVEYWYTPDEEPTT
jgi:hypothetical protein